MVELKTKYGVVLEDNETDRKIVNTLDKINDKLQYDVLVDLFDGDDNSIEAYVVMDRKTAYNYERKILKDIQNICGELGYGVEIEDTPDVDDDYGFYIKYDMLIIH